MEQVQGFAQKEMLKPDLYVVARFLEALWDSGREYLKTQLQMAVGLNYNIYMKYLNWLEKKGLIVLRLVGKKKTTVRITNKGVKAYDSLVGWINDVIGGDLG